MLNAICFLFGFQLFGTALSHYFSLPVPGPVIGLIFFLIWLIAGWSRPKALDTLLPPFMQFLPLLFVPAVVGIIDHLDKIKPFAGELVVVIGISTVLGLVSCVLVFGYVASKTAPAKGEERRGS